MWRKALLLFIIMTLGGCSLPRIIVLDDPLTAEEHLNLGVAYEQKGQYDLAIKEYETASKRIPRAYLYLGNTYFQKAEYAKAERFYRKAIRKDPNPADAYNNLAWLLFSQGQKKEEAKALVLKAIDLNPGGRETYLDTLQKIEAR